MARTSPTSRDIRDGSLKLEDFDTTTVGNAVITKVIAGTGISISNTGIDTGTGEVTINSAGGGGNGLIKDVIASAETFTINNEFQAVICGCYDIQGTLTNEGILCVI